MMAAATKRTQRRHSVDRDKAGFLDGQALPSMDMGHDQRRTTGLLAHSSPRSKGWHTREDGKTRNIIREYMRGRGHARPLLSWRQHHRATNSYGFPSSPYSLSKRSSSSFTPM